MAKIPYADSFLVSDFGVKLSFVNANHGDMNPKLKKSTVFFIIIGIRFQFASFFHTFRKKKFYLSVQRAEIILRPA